MAIYSRSFIQNTYCRWLWIRKTNALLKLIKNQTDIDKIYKYAKDRYVPNYQYLINKREKADKIYRKCTAEPYSFLVIDATLPSGNPLKFRKNLLK